MSKLGDRLKSIAPVTRDAVSSILNGKIHKCPECFGILRKCSYCDGSGKVTQRQLTAYSNPIAELLRRRKQRHLDK